jgi:hypothetical protein
LEYRNSEAGAVLVREMSRRTFSPLDRFSTSRREQDMLRSTLIAARIDPDPPQGGTP